MEKIYLNKLDIGYFKKCAEEAVSYEKEEYSGKPEILKEKLECIKRQCYGLRDVFWLFIADDIYQIAEPVNQALKELQS